MLWRYAQHLFHSLGQLRLANGDVDAALAYADECLSSAESTASAKNIVKARRLRAQALLAHGDVSLAEDELESAMVTARQLGNPPQLWKTLVALGDARLAHGQPAEARDTYREAIQIVNNVVGQLTDERLRQTLLSSAQVQHLVTRANG